MNTCAYCTKEIGPKYVRNGFLYFCNCICLSKYSVDLGRKDERKRIETEWLDFCNEVGWRNPYVFLNRINIEDKKLDRPKDWWQPKFGGRSNTYVKGAHRICGECNACKSCKLCKCI